MTLREKTIKFNIGNKTIGGSNDILIQTMANIKTSKVEEILALDKELKALGNDLLRLSVLDEEDAEAFKELVSSLNPGESLEPFFEQYYLYLFDDVDNREWLT